MQRKVWFIYLKVNILFSKKIKKDAYKEYLEYSSRIKNKEHIAYKYSFKVAINNIMATIPKDIKIF